MGEENVRRIMVLGEVPTMGPVVMYDNLEDVFKWTITGNAGDFAGTKDTTTVYNGGASMKLLTRITGAQAADYVQGLRTSFQRPGKRYAIECIWRPESATLISWVTFEFNILDGGFRHQGSIICDVEGARWYYRRSDGGEVELPDSPGTPAHQTWHRLRLEFDESTGKYIKLIADGKEVDMSALSYQKGVNVSPVKFEWFVKVVNVTTIAAEMYVDDVLIMEI